MFSKYCSILVLSCSLSLWWGGGGGFSVITMSHPTFCCVGVGLWLRWGWAVTTKKHLITIDNLTYMEYNPSIIIRHLIRMQVSSSTMAELGQAQLQFVCRFYLPQELKYI